MLGSHTTASSTVAALVRSSALSLSSQVTIYGWSTNHPEHAPNAQSALAQALKRQKDAGDLTGSARLSFLVGSRAR
jgi:hypothetical protein